ncbi:putative endoglucanase, partial [Delphinella strobiligena]
MHSQSPLKTALATCTILSLAPQAFAHMQMIWPYAIRSSYNPANNYEDIDYSMTSPLVADGSNFPCKGYQNDRPNGNVVTYTAGSTYNMSLAGSATHGGGSCQLSLSYDNGGTFRVIQSMIGGCPLTSTYNFTIPSYVPAGQALFAWSWQNLVGNREYYMNCADVKIVASTNSKRDASSTFSSFDDLPFIYKANLEGLNNCSTVETVVPVYPEPGPAVIYGTGATSSS